MPELPPDPASGAEPADPFGDPVTGVFRSSWRAVLRGSAWTAVIVLVAEGAYGWYLKGNLWIVGFAAVFASLWAAAEAAPYRIWGVERVEITPEASGAQLRSQVGLVASRVSS